jgi:hypothetical protein
MAKTILVPIDFRIVSLNTLKIALESHQYEAIRVVLLYAEHLDDSISDFLFYSPHRTIHSLITPEFKEALEIIKNRFEDSLRNIKIELFHGRTSNAMCSFLDAHNIDEIYVPKNHEFNTTKKAFNPVPLLKKSQYPIFEIPLESMSTQTEHGQLLELFY